MFVKSLPRISICLFGALLAFVFSAGIAGSLHGYFSSKHARLNLDTKAEKVVNATSRAAELLKSQKESLEELAKSVALSDNFSKNISGDQDSNWIQQYVSPLISRKGSYTQVDSFIISDGKKIVLSHNLLNELRSLDEFNAQPIVKSAYMGEASSALLYSNNDIWIVSAAPIMPLYDRAHVTGVLLLARGISPELLDWLGRTVGSNVTLVLPSSVEYPATLDRSLAPPLFNDSLNLVARGEPIRFNDFLANPLLLRAQNDEKIGILWTWQPFGSDILAAANRSFILSNAFRTGMIVGVIFAICTYAFLYFLIRRPVRRALSRMASDTLNLDDFNFESVIDEVRSVKRAVARLQRTVAQSREVRKTILSSIGEGFQLLDLDGNTLEVNPAICQLVGVSRDKFLKESDPFFYLTEEGRSLGQEFLELVRKGETSLKRGFEAELNWADSDHKHMRVRLCAVEDEDIGESHVCIFVCPPDGQAEQQFNVEELGKMTLLVKFTGSIAHNLNNTFTGILSAVSLFERKKLDEATEKHLLVTMRDAVKRGTSLCSELLHMSKVRQVLNSRRPVDICPVLNGVIRMSSELQEAKLHQINLSMPEGPIFALCDDSGLHHVLLNLILNAVDAMSDPGVISVQVEVQKEGDASEVVIRVSDTGVGMKPDVQKMIFNPYFTTKKGRSRKKTFGGSGLGLASALESIRSWGGKIDCDSELGEGSTFMIKLQCALPNQPVEAIVDTNPSE